MPDASIDKLSIEISANLKSVNSQIDKLVSKLGYLSKSLGGLDTKGLQKFSSSISLLGNGMQQLQGVKLPDFTRVAKGIQKFESIDGTKLSQVSNSLIPVANGIKSISSVNFNNTSITNLINSLTRLSNSNVSSLGTIGFTALGNNINLLTRTLENSKNVSSNTIQIVNAIARLAAAGENAQLTSNALPSFGKNVKSVINYLSGSFAVSQETIQFATALGTLASAGARTTTTANNLNLLAVELKKFFQIMSTAPMISNSIIQMTQALGNLASNGNRVGATTRGLSSSLNAWGNSASIGTKKIFSLASAIGKVYASYWLLFRVFGVLKKAIDISGALTEVQNVVAHSFGPSMDKVEEQSKNAIKSLGMSELSFKKYASTYQSMGMAMGVTSEQVSKANDYLANSTDGYVKASDDMAYVSLNLTKLAGDIASFYDKDQASVAEDLQAVYTGMVQPLRKYGLDLTQATLKEWALSQGVDANIDSMSQAEKTMLRYQYVMSQTTAAHGDFARTADTWNNQVRLLSENFQRLGSVWGNAGINMLKPLLSALNKGMDAVVTFSENIVNALGAIFGWKLEIQRGSLTDDFENAASGADDLASGTGKAANNAKKLKQQLQGFDELNVLTSPNDGSSSGGSSGSGDSASGGSSGGMKFNVTETDGLYKSSIKNLEQLGEYINNVLTKTMEGIDWDSVYKGANNFGKGLADFLNGLISPDLFYITGETVASSLNTAIYSALSFGENFDFANFGLSIADGINGFFDTFDFKFLAKTLNAWSKGFEDAFVNAITNIDWKDIIKGAFEFLDELDLGTMTLLVGSIWWKNKGGELFKNGIGSLLSKEISTGIGDKTLSVGNAIKISVAVAIAGFKIGNWLYENTNVSKFSDAIAAWIIDGDGDINIAKVLTIAIPALVLSIGAVSLGAKAISLIEASITSAVVSASTNATNTINASGTLGKIGKIGSAIGTIITAGLIGYGLGTAIYNQFHNEIDYAVEKAANYVKGLGFSPSDQTDTNDTDYANIYERSLSFFNDQLTEKARENATKVADAWEENMKRGMNSVDAFAAALDVAEELGGKIPEDMRRITEATNEVTTATGKTADELYHYGDQYKKTTKTISNYGDKYKSGEQKNTKTIIRAYEELEENLAETSKKTGNTLTYMSNYGDKYKENVVENKTPVIRAYQELVEKLNSTKNSTKTTMSSMASSTKTTMSSMTSSISSNALSMQNNVVSSFDKMNTSGSNSMSIMHTSVIGSISGIEETSKSKFLSMLNDATSKSSSISSVVATNIVSMKNSSSNSLLEMSSDVVNKLETMKNNSSAGGTGVKNAFINSLEGLKRGANDKWNGVNTDTKNNVNAVKSTIQKENWNSIGMMLVEGLRVGITNKWNSRGNSGLIGGIVSLASGLTSALKKAFGIHSPSKVWENEIGAFLPAGLSVGIEGNKQGLFETISNLGTDMTDAMYSSLNFSDPLQDFEMSAREIEASINSKVSTSTFAKIDSDKISLDIANDIASGMSMSQAEQNRLLREQNDLLKQLLQKDTNISSNDIFESVKKSNRQAYNRTGTNPLLY